MFPTFKLANPLNYPLVVLLGGMVLVAGVRFFRLPNAVIVPIAGAVMVAGAGFRKAHEPQSFNLSDPQLEKELRQVHQAALALKERADALRAEAARLLTEASQMNVLAAVNLSCDRATELPTKVDELGRRLQRSGSILSTAELQRQLAEVQRKARASSGIARTHLEELEDSLQRNLQLAQDGQDTRLAQVLSLAKAIQDTGGVLQRLQNQLRMENLDHSENVAELQALNDELLSLQENIEFWVER